MSSDKYSFMRTHECTQPAARTLTHKHTQRDTLVSLPAVILLLTFRRRDDEGRGQCVGSQRSPVRGSPGFLAYASFEKV